MKRFLTIPNRFSENILIDYVHQDAHDDCRIVDDSSYVSNKRANQILAKQFASNLLDKLSYDSLDDIKAGSVNVYARQKGRDIAELTQQMRNLQSKAEKALIQDISVFKDKQTQAQAQAQAESQTQSQVSSKE